MNEILLKYLLAFLTGVAFGLISCAVVAIVTKIKEGSNKND